MNCQRAGDRRMRNAIRGAAALAVALAAGAALAADGAAVRSRDFQLTYRVSVRDLSPGARTVDLWIPYPQTDRSQTIHQVTVHAPGAVTLGREPKYGNIALHLRAEAALAPLEVSLVVDASRRENAGAAESLSPEAARAYLGAEPLVPLAGPVKRLAMETTRGLKSDGEKARAIYDRVTEMMKYDKSGTGWGRGDAVWACDARRGNCTDFHALIIGMARSVGIPARFAIGFPLPEARGAGEILGYHCWAELYVRGQGWIPVDSSEGAKALARGDRRKKDYYYGHHDENRLEFSRGRDLVLNPPQRGGPLNYFVYPYVEVDGKPHAGVERKFTYVDRTADSTTARR